MSAYANAVLATSGLRNYWILDGDVANVDLVNGVPLDIRSAIIRLVAGRTEGEAACRWNRSQTAPNNVIYADPAPLNAPCTIEALIRWPTAAALGTGGTGVGLLSTRNGLPSFPNPGIQITLDAGGGPPYMNYALGDGSATWWVGPWTDISAWAPYGSWFHFAIAVGADGSHDFMFDGVTRISSVWSAGMAGRTPMCFGSYPLALILGNYEPNPSNSPNFGYGGEMQHVAAYNVKLSEATVAAHVAALGSIPTPNYKAPVATFPLYTRVRNFGIATISKSLPRTLSIARGGAYRAGRSEGGFEFPLGTTINVPTPLIGGISRPGRMVGAPPGEFSLPAPITPKLMEFGAGGVGRPLAGQVWPPAR